MASTVRRSMAILAALSLVVWAVGNLVLAISYGILSNGIRISSLMVIAAGIAGVALAVLGISLPDAMPRWLRARLPFGSVGLFLWSIGTLLFGFAYIGSGTKVLAITGNSFITVGLAFLAGTTAAIAFSIECSERYRRRIIAVSTGFIIWAVGQLFVSLSLIGNAPRALFITGGVFAAVATTIIAIAAAAEALSTTTSERFRARLVGVLASFVAWSIGYLVEALSELGNGSTAIAVTGQSIVAGAIGLLALTVYLMAPDPVEPAERASTQASTVSSSAPVQPTQPGTTAGSGASPAPAQSAASPAQPTPATQSAPVQPTQPGPTAGSGASPAPAQATIPEAQSGPVATVGYSAESVQLRTEAPGSSTSQ